MLTARTLRPITVAGGVFALLLVLTFVVIIRIGKSYEWGLLGFTKEQPPDEISLVKKKQLKKITIRRGDEAGCMEVTPDGAVRIYSTCGTDLERAHRPTDPKNVLKLFKLVSERDIATVGDTTAPGTLYVLTIESDEGIETVYIVVLEDTPQSIQDIIEIIEEIEADVPFPSVTPLGSTPAPTSPASSTGTPVPSVTLIPTAGPTPTPTGPAVDLGFLCDFFETTGPKPYNISNFVCSTGPTPYPQ
jgi:hypothetical protein